MASAAVRATRVCVLLDEPSIVSFPMSTDLLGGTVLEHDGDISAINLIARTTSSDCDTAGGAFTSFGRNRPGLFRISCGGRGSLRLREALLRGKFATGGMPRHVRPSSRTRFSHDFLHRPLTGQQFAQCGPCSPFVPMQDFQYPIGINRSSRAVT